MNGIMTVLLTIIIFCGVMALIYIINYNNLQAYKIKINEAESIIDELLRKKYDTLMLIKDVIIEETDVDKKIFSEMDKVKDMNISSFDFERKLAEFNGLIEKIKADYDKLNEDVRFSNYAEEIYVFNEKLEATKSFYNKYTNLLNQSIKKFPSNVIAFIHHMEVQPFFDGKDMFDDDINDFKL